MSEHLLIRRAIIDQVPEIRALTLRAYAKWIDVTPREPRPMTADYDVAFREHRFDCLYQGDGRLRDGVHPQFTQDDWRGSERYQHLDRVLLNLWSKDGLMWGDAGQAQFMISRQDLLKRDFSKVHYQWDCS